MKMTKMFLVVGALLVGATLAFAVPFQAPTHVTTAMHFYDNAPGSDYNTMIAEQPSIVIDGYNERIQMGPGGSTAPLTVLAPGAAVGDIYVGGAGYVTTVRGALVLNTWQEWGATDTTPDVSGYTYFYTDNTVQTLTDFDGTTIAAGQIVIVESTAAVTFDVTSSGLVCGTTDVVTADGDLTAWIYNGTDWLCISFFDLSDNANTWGA